MNTLSVQNTQIQQPISIYPISEVKRDFSVEFQRAFEEFDVDQITNLLNQGANPYQAIELNSRLSYTLLRPYIESVFEREGALDEMSTFTLVKLQSITDDEKVIARVLSVVDAIKADPDSVTDLELIDVATALSNFANYSSVNPDYPKLSVMALALMLRNLDLMKSLVQAGVDFSDSKVMETLVEQHYTVTLTDPETGETSYSNSIDISPQNPENPVDETLEELFNEECGFGFKDLQRIRELQNQGCVLDFKHERIAIFGRVDVEGVLEIVENFLEIIDFLIEQGIARKDILKVEDDIFENFEIEDIDDLEDLKAVVDFLTSRGFEAPGLFRAANGLSRASSNALSEKNCWDPRTWTNDASDDEPESLKFSQKL